MESIRRGVVFVARCPPMGSIRRGVVFVAGCPMGTQQSHHARCCSWLGAIVGVFRRVHRVRRACQVPATTDELELRYATAGALTGTANRLYADSNSGFKVRYRSLPTVQSGYTITH